MKILTWNVNSIRVRLERLTALLERRQPDVLCLQELKVVDEKFPHEELEKVGYFAAVHGQKTYNGVAILAREKPTDVLCGLNDNVDDPQARLIAATVGGVRVISAYVPNGSTVGSEKYAYKLAWYARLRRYLEKHADPKMPVALCGDFNVAIDDGDVKNVDEWRDSVLCHDEARAALRHVLDWGLVDTFRKYHEEGGVYSWWDYRQLGFQKNNGLRIDMVFCTESLDKRSTAAWVDRDERRGKQPSDHAPVGIEFSAD